MCLERFTTSLFTKEIDSVTPPPPPPVKNDGKPEAYTHLMQYKLVMSLFTQGDAFLCKVLPASLGSLGLTWFNQLLPPPGSISSFDSLCSVGSVCDKQQTHEGN